MLTKLKYSHSVNYLKHSEYLCDCGNVKIIRDCHVASGAIKSCGCFKLKIKEYRNIRRTEHNTWKALRQRCNNKNHARYSDWGGRGISVCVEWDSFEVFFNDMGFKPSKNHSIDRIDNDKGYSKLNCRWATQKEQSSNQRLYKKNKVGFSGVEIMKNNTYKASARVDGILHHLGTHNNLFDAVCARQSFNNIKGKL